MKMTKYNRFLLYWIVGLLLLSCKDPIDQPVYQLPAHLRDGITRISNDSLAFVLFAPGKTSVHLVGDFNKWQISDTYQFHKDGDRFWIKTGDWDVNREYVLQYVIDRQIYIADPYAYRVIDRNNNNNIPAMVITTKKDNYPWKIENFTVTGTENLMIYEILIRDFTTEGKINGVREKLPYLKELGVNAIELMPFNEFEGSDGWGYNPSFYFTPENSYGTGADFKAFIDECHVNGMAVIMDIVLNHSYGQSPMVRMYQDAAGKVTPDNPWYNVNHNFANPDAQWGYDFNHESPYTQAFVDSICSYWMKEYKIDGFRFDFTKGFSNTPYPATGDNWGSSYDAARIKNLKRIYDGVKKRKNDAIFIIEHLSENREEKELADYGILLWGNLNYNVNEMTMGYGEEGGNNPKGDISWGCYKQRGWTHPHLVAYMESHDEERLMFKNVQYGKNQGGYNVKDIPVGLQRNAAAAVILFSLPGPKMIWQFGELGYDYSINSRAGSTVISESNRLARKEIRWDYYDQPERKVLFDVYAQMIDLRKNRPVFSTSDYTIDLTNHFKTVVLKSVNETAVAMANFDVVSRTKNVNFTMTGVWKDYFSESEITTTTDATNITLNPGEYRLYFCK